MSEQNRPQFQGGTNIAMKLPSHLFEKTVSFSRDILRLPVLEEAVASVPFDFGASRLWLDRTDHFSQAEIWLELTTDDVPAAADYLAQKGTARRDEIEALSEGFEGFWISNPANLIHLVSRKQR